jgi:hypothetical protein
MPKQRRSTARRRPPTAKEPKQASQKRRQSASRRREKRPRKRSARKSNPKTLLRVFETLNLSRRKKMSPSAAAKAAGTTLPTMRRLVPDALVQDHPGGPIRVKRSDRYLANVEILATGVGPIVVTAHGSRQRGLAGQHRAAYTRVLQGIDLPSILDQFRGKKVGRHELLSSYEELQMLASAGYLSQLDTLYVLPGTGT